MPETAAGERFVELARKHATAAAERAPDHDRAGAFQHETFAEMQASGFLAACLPEALGGLGLTRTRDIAAGFNRLARGDGATALAAHMHTLVAMGMARLRDGIVAAGGEMDAWLESLIGAIGRGEALICVAGTEPGQTLGWFETAGTPVDGGFLVNGRKAFASGSPACTHLYVMLRVPGGTGWLNAVGLVERAAAGVRIADDWDAMGMRGSGSNSVVFEDCFVPRDHVIPVSPALQPSSYWIRFFVEGTVGLLACFLGVAEAARDLAVDRAVARTSVVSGRSAATKPGVQQAVAELEVRIACARAVVERIAGLSDRFYAQSAGAMLPIEDHHRLMAEFQTAKLFVNRAAIEAVDFALTVSGGRGYMAADPLSRLYRDVRAGPFMQAYSPIEAYEFIGKVALGVEPELTD